MVALHNRKLTAKDIWPGVLWTRKEWFALSDRYRAQLIAKGIQEPQLSFRLSRMIEDYQRTQPSMRERQEILRRIYPPRIAPPKGPFTKEELDWLLERLDRVNDPVGVNIVTKLNALHR